jgi:hypothetical protein
MNAPVLEIHDELGARWHSLVDPAGREWLWCRWDESRRRPTPGGPFIDVGGAEECFPTIVGNPDHGDVWSRPWTAEGDWRRVSAAGATLRRRVRQHESSITVDYAVSAPPGYRFLWAFHALLDPSVGTRIAAPSGWPAHAYPMDEYREVTSWPDVMGEQGFDVLGPDDGTALFCALPALDRLAVVADGRRLTFSLDVDGQPHAMAIWRNLGGYPWDEPAARFRNFGIEPMLGCALDLEQAADDEVATVPASGALEWRLTLSFDADDEKESAP